LTPVENAIVGTLAGAIEVTTLQPLVFWKNASQQNLPFTLNPKYLYRGLLMSVTNMAVLTGIQFPMTGMITKTITQGQQRRLTNNEMIGAGFGAGFLSGLVCGPMELVMIQQQRFGGSIVQVPNQIVSRYGVLGMFRGLSMACGREAFFTAGYLGLGPAAARELSETYGYSDTNAKMLGAIGAGLVAATLSHPMDTLKTCLQGDIARTQFTTLSQTAKTLVKQQGYGRFFYGYQWRTGRMILSIFIINQVREIVAPLLYPKYFK